MRNPCKFNPGSAKNVTNQNGHKAGHQYNQYLKCNLSGSPLNWFLFIDEQLGVNNTRETISEGFVKH